MLESKTGVGVGKGGGGGGGRERRGGEERGSGGGGGRSIHASFFIPSFSPLKLKSPRGAFFLPLAGTGCRAHVLNPRGRGRGGGQGRAGEGRGGLMKGAEEGKRWKFLLPRGAGEREGGGRNADKRGLIQYALLWDYSRLLLCDHN